ncbi:Symplekin tight junction protein C terminal-domain-containing protein [Ochromonadaceae sp. CCMP2298]|nr:Symplekin tight junction protein C terminal-domain-containing protein [Ochromonadaceae sp. CCMP2298]
MEEGEGGEWESHSCTSLYDAYGKFDGGNFIGGAFQGERDVEELEGVGGAGEQTEVQARRVIQLLSQLCVVDLRLLGAFAEMYAVSSRAEAEAVESGAEEAAEEAKSEAPEDTAVSSSPTPAPAPKWKMTDTLTSSLRNILPAIYGSNSPEEAFTQLAQATAPEARPLLEAALNVLYADFSAPATLAMVSLVRKFATKGVAAAEAVAAAAVMGEAGEAVAGEGEGATEEKEEKGAVAGTGAGAGVEEVVLLYRITDAADFRLMLPLISGLPASEVEASLPAIIRQLDPEALKVVFSRITKARPPPLTKAALLVALHRIDFKAVGLESKPVLEAISLCLNMNNKSDFSGEVIKDALRTMLADPVPPYALMRTAILSAKSFTEVSRFVLSDVIPALVRRRAWSLAPSLWDGVMHAAKNLAAAGAKNSELTLRALLGVPAVQLRGVLKVAPQVKAAMAKLLKTLSKEETEEVTTGRWVGLLEKGVEEEEAEKQAKQKLVADIAAV